jgi:hypothetical protein
MVMGIVDRGANVQAGNVLRELLAAYEFTDEMYELSILPS